MICDGRVIIDISIHAPRAGSDVMAVNAKPMLFIISIHAPRAGSDLGPHAQSDHKVNFNPRSPCGERRAILASLRLICKFQSTLPVRGATVDSQISRAPA